MATLCFTTVPLFVVLILNIVLYALKIHSETRRIRKTLGTKPASVRAEHQAAKAMSLFVAAFFIQWWALSIYGIWALVGQVPEEYFYLLITFDNLGGIFNLGVYIIIRRRKLTQGEKTSVDGKGTHVDKETCVTRFSETCEDKREHISSNHI